MAAAGVHSIPDIERLTAAPGILPQNSFDECLPAVQTEPSVCLLRATATIWLQGGVSLLCGRIS